jgi:archaellum biogenesis protein FlaJ (TadC family)
MHDQRPVNLMSEIEASQREFQKNKENKTEENRRIYLLPVVGIIIILIATIMTIRIIIQKLPFTLDIVSMFLTGIILLSTHMRIAELEEKNEAYEKKLELIDRQFRHLHQEFEKNKKGN